MHTTRRLLVTLCFSAMSAAVATPSALAANEIVAGSITNSPPMIAYASDGSTLQGVIVDLAAAMSQKLGKPIVFNICVLGALLGINPIVSPASVMEVIKTRVPPEFVKMNNRALDIGLVLGANR